MQKLSYYYQKSLLGYCLERLKQRWSMRSSALSEWNYHGVTIDLISLPKGMREVIISGNYERAEVMLLDGFVGPEDRILEIGSAIGFIGLHCRKVIGVKELVCIEPNPQTETYLRKNYLLNNLSPNFVSAAIASNDGPIEFYVSDMFWCDSLDSRTDVETGKKILVDGITFESLLKRTGVDFNTLIIDIEGAEKFISAGSIPNAVKKVLIEIHPEVIGIRSAYKIVEELIRIGFEIRGREQNTWALLRSPN